MAYKLKSPCSNCPFRTDIRPYLRADRAEEILTSQGEFHCHKTVTLDDDGEIADASKSQVCAGFLICLEHDETPNQMMRIAERLRIYDRTKLDMNAPVYWSVAEAIEAHERVDAQKSLRIRRLHSWGGQSKAHDFEMSDGTIQTLTEDEAQKHRADYQQSAEFPEELK